jgi:hypothetical protein
LAAFVAQAVKPAASAFEPTSLPFVAPAILSPVFLAASRSKIALLNPNRLLKRGGERKQMAYLCSSMPEFDFSRHLREHGFPPIG